MCQITVRITGNKVTTTHPTVTEFLKETTESTPLFLQVRRKLEPIQTESVRSKT